MVTPGQTQRAEKQGVSVQSAAHRTDLSGSFEVSCRIAFLPPPFSPSASAPARLAAEIRGDATAGSAKAAVCTACHGLNGNSANPELGPVIAGQNAAYVRDQVTRIKTGMRVAPLMQPMVKDLTEQDIADVAAFFATQTPAGHEADPSYWKAGQKLYRSGDAARGIPACTSCHGPLGRGIPGRGLSGAAGAVRRVHGEAARRLRRTARATRRMPPARPQSSPNAPIMATIAARLTAEDRRNLASYIQGLR